MFLLCVGGLKVLASLYGLRQSVLDIMDAISTIYYLLHFTSCDGDGSQHNISPGLKQFKNKVNNHSELFPLASRLKMNVFQGITISSKVSPKKSSTIFILC